MIQIPMTTAQFAAARAAITMPGAVKSYIDNGLTGSIATNSTKGGSVEFDYSFNPLTLVMTLSNLQKHGTAKFLGEDNIRQRAMTMMNLA